MSARLEMQYASIFCTDDEDEYIFSGQSISLSRGICVINGVLATGIFPGGDVGCTVYHSGVGTN